MKKYVSLFGAVFLLVMLGCASTQSQAEKPVPNEAPKRADVTTVVSQLSQQISSTMLEQNKRRVAVMNFSLVTGESTELGLYLSDKLTNSLFQYREKFEVIERAKLESVLKEIKLGMTGMIDDKTAQSIGKVLGADALVIGTITNLGNEIDINVRMLGTERANVLAVASALLDKTDAITKLMTNIRSAGEVKSAEQPAPKTQETGKPQQQSLPKTNVDDFIFEARECRAVGQKVACRISVINSDQETRRLSVALKVSSSYSNPKSTMVDDFGNQYLSVGGQFGSHTDKEFGDAHIDLPTNLPMALTLQFNGITPDAKYSTVILDVYADSKAAFRKPLKAVLRNVPVTR